MLNEEQAKQLRGTLQDAERKLLYNAQSSLHMSMDRETDNGRDSIDQSSSEELISTALRLRDREKKLLAKIRGAIDRLTQGSIDECEECGEAIGFKRLMARPVTTLCIDCKESAEEEERRHAGSEFEEADWGEVSAEE
ncbi:MAG: TraR/DksA C4-type zinc finger protein [Deltaproteobacteria bacterium]|nr:TraR/DksA C4-type zinc finger protein [Deltaproteobacteria bacterium]